jgi:hypothetical protein
MTEAVSIVLYPFLTGDLRFPLPASLGPLVARSSTLRLRGSGEDVLLRLAEEAPKED